MNLQFRDGAPPQWAIDAHDGLWLLVTKNSHGCHWPHTWYRGLAPLDATRVVRSAPLDSEANPVPYPAHPHADVWDAAIDAAVALILGCVDGEHIEDVALLVGALRGGWKAGGGYGNQSDGRGRDNASRERLWLSPSCLPLESERQGVLL